MDERRAYLAAQCESSCGGILFIPAQNGGDGKVIGWVTRSGSRAVDSCGNHLKISRCKNPVDPLAVHVAVESVMRSLIVTPDGIEAAKCVMERRLPGFAACRGQCAIDGGGFVGIEVTGENDWLTFGDPVDAVAKQRDGFIAHRCAEWIKVCVEEIEAVVGFVITKFHP